MILSLALQAARTRFTSDGLPRTASACQADTACRQKQAGGRLADKNLSSSAILVYVTKLLPKEQLKEHKHNLRLKQRTCRPIPRRIERQDNGLQHLIESSKRIFGTFN